MKRLVIIFLLLFSIPSSASALDNGEALGEGAEAGILTTTVVGVSSAVGLTGLIVVSTIKMLRDPETVTAFLKGNATRLRAELALGSGNVLDDFAKLMAIPDADLPGFEKKLRKNRKYISNFFESGNISVEKAKELITWVDGHYPAI